MYLISKTDTRNFVFTFSFYVYIFEIFREIQVPRNNRFNNGAWTIHKHGEEERSQLRARRGGTSPSSVSTRGKTLQDEAGNNAICRLVTGPARVKGCRPEEEKRRPNLPRRSENIEERKKKTSARRERARSSFRGRGGGKKGSASAFSFIIREKTERWRAQKGRRASK